MKLCTHRAARPAPKPRAAPAPRVARTPVARTPVARAAPTPRAAPAPSAPSGPGFLANLFGAFKSAAPAPAPAAAPKPLGTQPVRGRQGSVPRGRQASAAAPARSAAGPAVGGSKMDSGSLATYNGNGKYLAPAAVEALPKPKASSLMPGYNVFGDGMFFGEDMLKNQMVSLERSGCARERLCVQSHRRLVCRWANGRTASSLTTGATLCRLPRQLLLPRGRPPRMRRRCRSSTTSQLIPMTFRYVCCGCEGATVTRVKHCPCCCLDLAMNRC